MLNGMLLNDFTRNGTRAAIEFPDMKSINLTLGKCLGRRKDAVGACKDVCVKEQIESREAKSKQNYIMADNRLEIVDLERFDEFEDSYPSSGSEYDEDNELSTKTNCYNSVEMFQQTIPSHLLMVALLEHICSLYDEKEEKSKRLFTILCQQLAGMQIIPSFAVLEEFQFIRDKYRCALTDLMQFAVHRMQHQDEINSTINIDRSLAWYSNTSPRRSLSASKAGKIRTPSRFEEEFEEIDELGKGGFGSVYEVRNKLDGRRYAIKKIQLAEVNPEDCLKVLREVKVLADLEHSNIVRYHSAWLEYSVAETKIQTIKRNLSQPSRLTGMANEQHYDRNFGGAGDDFVSFKSETSAASDSSSIIVFETNSETAESNRQTECKRSLPQNHHMAFDHKFKPSANMQAGNMLVTRGHFGRFPNLRLSQLQEIDHKPNYKMFRRAMSNEEYSAKKLKSRITRHQNKSIVQDLYSPIKVTMHIQMELCSSTLKHWLNERNNDTVMNGSAINYCLNMDIFRQMLQGVHYVHKTGLMHRDLKGMASTLFHPLLYFVAFVTHFCCSDLLLYVAEVIVFRWYCQTIQEFGLAQHPENELKTLSKPRNIFINKDLLSSKISVKIGDFGLARKVTGNLINGDFKRNDFVGKFFDSNDDDYVATKGIGTCTYAAPEQLRTESYTSKADIYSLGIILFELFNPFATEMERHFMIKDIREGKPPAHFIAQWPDESKLIQEMTDHNPKKRPTAIQMLQISQFQDKDRIIEMLRADLLRRDRELRSLKETLHNRNLEIETLHRKVSKLESLES